MLRLARLFLVAMSAILPEIQAQQLGTGVYAHGSYDVKGFDTINLGNLNVHGQIPIVNKQGRELPFSYSVVYDSLVWSAVPSSGTSYWQPNTQFGFTGLASSGLTGYWTNTVTDIFCPSGSTYSGSIGYVINNFKYFDPYGGTHPFNYSRNGCYSPELVTGNGQATDGSGYLYSGGNIYSSNGTMINAPYETSAGGPPATGTVTDSNGNSITNNGNGIFVDTLGTAELTIAGTGNATSPLTFTYPVAEQSNGSTTATATVYYKTYSVQTNFGCSGISEYGPISNDLVDHITLATGDTYFFTYEATPGISGSVSGRLASVTLPVGGTITYSYSGGCGSGSGSGIVSDGTTASLTRSTTDGTSTYTRTNFTANGDSTVRTDEAGNQTVYAFEDVGYFFETQRQVYQGPASQNIQLQDVFTCYNTTNLFCDGTATYQPFTTIIVTSSYNHGTQLTRQFTYDSTGQYVTQEKDIDATGVLMNTVNTYAAPGPVTELTSTQVTDGSGNPISYESYGYDEAAPTATSGLPQHTTPSSYPGNLTSMHVSIDGSASTTGSNLISTTTTYNDAGMPTSVTAPGNASAATTYSYDSTGTFASNTNFPTTSSGVSLGISATYDTASGAMLTSTGMNSGETTTLNQYDSLLRPLQIMLPNGSQTTYTHSSPNHTMMFQDLGPSGTSQLETLLDSYGRMSRVGVYSGQSVNPWYQVDYCYNTTGLLQFQSVPYQTTGEYGPNGPTPMHCNGSYSGTAYQYDALGRVVSLTSPDGTASNVYSNRAVKTTDLNGVQRITQFDTLGRLTGVCEITSQTMGNQSPADCGMDIAGTGFLSSYSYSMASHTVTVNQGGQQRVFQTDASGRQILATEPERGTTTYTYEYNNTGLAVSRTRPSANQTNPNVKTNTLTQYDALGRVVGVSYDDGLTPSRTFFYDALPGNQGWNTATPSNPKGKLVATASGTGSFLARQLFSYDIMGNVQTLWQCAPFYCNGDQYHTGQWFSYDLGGNLIIAGDYASGQIAYTRSAAGEIIAVANQTYSDATNPSNLVSNVINGPFGPTNWTLGNGLAAVMRYDTLGRHNGSWICSGASTTSSAFCPGGSNQVYGVTTNFSGHRSTAPCDTVLNQCQDNYYDGLDRLVAASSTTNNAGASGSYTYTYDRWGNRTQQYSQQNQTAINFSYYPSNNQIVGYSYDAAGNLTSDGVAHSFTYDAEGNVLSVDSGNTASYVYDAMNHRVRVNQPSGTFEYTYNPWGQKVMRVNVSAGGGGDEGFIYADGARLGYRSLDGGTYFTHTDLQGTERMRTNAQGQSVFTATSLAFGDGLQRNPSSAAAGQDNGQFAGTVYDSESDTDHATYRQYNAAQGRWMSPDPYDGSYDFVNPQSFNRYSYVLNNPLSLVDPNGLDDCGDNYDSCVDVNGSEESISECWECGEYGYNPGQPPPYIPPVSPPAPPGLPAPSSLLGKICGAVPSGTVVSVSGNGNFVGTAGSLDLVTNGRTGEVTGFFSPGYFAGAATAGGSLTGGYTFGNLGSGNSNFAGGFTGISGGYGVYAGSVATSSGGPASPLSGISPTSPGHVTTVAFGVQTPGRALSASSTFSLPTQLGSLWTLADPATALVYLANQACKAAGH